MDATRFDDLLRSLADPLGRRRVSRVLLGLTVGGPLTVLGLAETEARNKRKKKRRRKKRKQNKPAPFCAGHNTCVAASPNCDDGSGGFGCTCFVTVEGKPFCGLTFRIDACAGCTEGETCIDISGSVCGGTTACAPACPTSL